MYQMVDTTHPILFFITCYLTNFIIKLSTIYSITKSSTSSYLGLNHINIWLTAHDSSQSTDRTFYFICCQKNPMIFLSYWRWISIETIEIYSQWKLIKKMTRQRLNLMIIFFYKLRVSSIDKWKKQNFSLFNRKFQTLPNRTNFHLW